MKTSILELCEMQNVLDDRIISEKGIQWSAEDRFQNTLVSLIVELGEFYNETRVFKVWSEDQKPRYEKHHIHVNGEFSITYPLLEEFVDCVHFFLSLANQKGWQETINIEMTIYEKSGSRPVRNFDFLMTIKHLMRLVGEQLRPDSEIELGFRLAWEQFLILGMAEFGFTWEQIVEAYKAKNEKNHIRQDTNY